MIKTLEQVYLDVMKFVFHRFAPDKLPTDEQLLNALEDYRNNNKENV